MAYPKVPDYRALAERITLSTQLAHEHGASGIAPILKKLERAMKQAVRDIERLPDDPELRSREPDSLPAVRKLRPAGARRLWTGVDEERFASRLSGALLGRFAGCTLGAPVEFWEIDRMKELAKSTGHSFPPLDYWPSVPDPDGLRYGVSRRRAYTRDGIHGVPVDDDITYTLLGLLILEDYGIDFTVDDVGTAWMKYLPTACTAEKAALDNLRRGVPAAKAGVTDNPYREWIGADIRSDPWGYAAPGWPEKAAELAWRDATLSHRRQGIYGEMYFSAAISAAFAVDDPIEALRIGLTEIPSQCALSKAIRWALETAPDIRTYADARAAMETRFRGMHRVHTINNACLTVWGIMIGGTDFTRVISETVAMGMDNDCTAATAGSIVGAVVGKERIPEHWTRGFDNTVYTYMNRRSEFRIDDVVRRFIRQAKKIHRG